MLRLVELETVPPAPGQVRVAVRAAGVNPIDWKIRSGAAAAWMPVDLPRSPGTEVAGVVEAVGEGVAGFRPGDEGEATTGRGSIKQSLRRTRARRRIRA